MLQLFSPKVQKQVPLDMPCNLEHLSINTFTSGIPLKNFALNCARGVCLVSGRYNPRLADKESIVLAALAAQPIQKQPAGPTHVALGGRELREC
eukprot:3501760-Heterocapsa_arctica.AAC.1